MNSTRLNIAIEVDDKGTVKIRQLGKTAEKAGARAEKGFKRAGRTLGDYAERAAKAAKATALIVGAGVTAGLVAMTAAMKKAVGLANEQEKVETRLAAVLKATGNASGYNIEQLKAMASSMQNVTTVGDEVILSGMGILATFKNVRGEGFERATMAALDMSNVMGTDLNSSITQIGKALNDPIQGLTALSRVGVTFTDQQKEQIKVLQASGDMMSAQNIILKELESEFGGAASAAVKDFDGKVSQLSNSYGDMWEQLGFAITKSDEFKSEVDSLRQEVEKFTAYIKAHRDEVGGFFLLGVKGVHAMLDAVAELNKFVAWALGEILIAWDNLVRNFEIGAVTIKSAVFVAFDEITEKVADSWEAIYRVLDKIPGVTIEGGDEYVQHLRDMSTASEDYRKTVDRINASHDVLVTGLRKTQQELVLGQEATDNASASYKQFAGAADVAGLAAAEAAMKTQKNAQKTAKVVCEAHKKQLTCAQKATVKAVEYDIKYHKERYRNTDMFVGKIEADKRAAEMIKAQERATNEAINADLEAAMNERDDLYGLHAEKVNQLQQNMVNDLGRIFDSYISDVLHGQIDSVGDLFKGLFDSILDMFMRMVAQFAANSLVDLIFGNGASGGTTLGSALSSLFGGSGSGGGLGLAYNGASVANTVSGWLGGPSTSSITAPISQYASGQLGLGSGTLGTNLMTGAHALYGAATTGVGSISSWYAGLQAAANGVNAGTSLALIEGSYGPAAEVVGTQIGATAGEEMAATLANTTVDFSIDAAGGYAASTGGSAASTGAGAGSAGWASAGWVALPLVGGSIWMGLENATDDKPAEQARKNWGLDTGISRDNLLAEEAIGTLSKKLTEQFEHVFDFATQGFGNLADMSHQLGAAMDVQHVQQYVSTLAGVNVSMEQSTQVMALAHEAAQGNEAAFNQLYETLNGMMEATGDSTEYASASAYGLVQAMIDAGQATDATIAELNGITQEMIDQQAAADALADAMVASGIATEDTADQISAAYGSGIEAVEQYIQHMNGLDEEWLSSADIMNDVRAAASGGAGALQTLINDLEGTGLSSTQAAQAAQAMTDAVRRFSATNLDLEATARLNVEVQGAANITSSVVGNVNTSSRYFDPYDPYGDAEGSALGGVVERPTWFSPFNYAGEAGPEAITPLRHPKQINHIEDKVDRLLAEAGNRPMVIHLHNYVAGQKVEEIILPVVDRHIDSRERSGISGRAVYAAG